VNQDSHSVSTVLLAGGFGTRIAHLLPDIPKPMAPVAGKPFVEWVVRYFSGCGLRHFILSTGYRADVIEAYFSENPVDNVNLVCRKETVPLGTAGGFLNATEHVSEPAAGWLVANADSLVATDPMTLVHAAANGNWDAAILGLQVSDASRFGSLRLGPDGTLREFSEKRPGAGLINAGLYWFAPGCRDKFPSKRPLSFELDVFPGLIEKRMCIGVVPVLAPFIDIGTPASLAEAETFVTRMPGKTELI
jgi:D-glycero-alpha-D-manno-heptose 1-phosphate guanylyltransferase